MTEKYKIGLVIGENCVTWVILKKNALSQTFFMKHPDDVKGSLLEQFLVKHPYMPLWILVDTADQFFTHKNIPSLTVWDRYLFLKNAKRQSTSQEGKGLLQLSESNILTVSFTITPYIAAWFTFLQSLSNSIRSLSSLTLEGVSLFPYFEKAYPDALLLTRQTSGFLRHIGLSQGRFALSRLTPFTSAEQAQKDIASTLSYMTQQAISSPHTVILEDELHILCPAAELYKPQELLKRMNIKNLPSLISMEALYITAFMTQQSPFLSFDLPVFQEKTKKAWYMGLAQKLIAGICLVSCLFGGYLFLQIYQANSHFQALAHLLEKYKIAQTLPPIPETQKDTFQHLDLYYGKVSKASFLPFYQKILKEIPKSWAVELLDWTKIPTQERIELRLLPNTVNRLPLDAQEIISSFQKTFPDYKFHALKTPDQSSLQEYYDSSKASHPCLHLVLIKEGTL